MTPSARLQAVLEILEALGDQSHPADATVSGYFRARRYVGSKDRAAISSNVYDIMRHRARLGWWCEKYGADISPVALAMAYSLLVEGKKGEDFAKLCSGGKFAPQELTAKEMAFARSLSGHTLAHPDMPEAVEVECPSWAEEGLRARFGGAFKKEMAALLRPAALDLRANSFKIKRDEALAELKACGFQAEACRFSPFGIRIANRPDLNNIAMLKDGRLEIQDEGSQLVALLADPRPGQRVVDFCAGAGGKTLAMAAMMENRGHIVACDVIGGRLKRGSERIRKAGFHNVESRILESERDPWVKKHKQGYDRVLVDAPCSGTGTWRRNPDARWRKSGLENLLPLQAAILDSAARLVKKGGRLVYATCSFLPEENERRIEAFLAEHPEFAAIPVSEALVNSAISGVSLPMGEGTYLSLTPHSHGTDGFFAAVLELKKE